MLEEIEALAGTTACKSVQLVRLKKWAEEQGCWYNDRSQFGEFFDRGSENEVYLSPDGMYIIKLNDFRYSDDNLNSFFERIKAHNNYFPDCKYDMIGFAENQDGKVCAILIQPFIADARLATKEEIRDEFLRLGFHPEDDGEYYSNGQHDIFDAVDGKSQPFPTMQQTLCYAVGAVPPCTRCWSVLTERAFLSSILMLISQFLLS